MFGLFKKKSVEESIKKRSTSSSSTYCRMHNYYTYELSKSRLLTHVRDMKETYLCYGKEVVFVSGFHVGLKGIVVHIHPNVMVKVDEGVVVKAFFESFDWDKLGVSEQDRELYEALESQRQECCNILFSS